MIEKSFRQLRRTVVKPTGAKELFRGVTDSVAAAEWCVKLYYAASVYVAARLLSVADSAVMQVDNWDLLWPLAWLEGSHFGYILRLLSVACFLSSLVAFQFHRHLAARVAFLVLFFLVATVPNSLGGINHPYHAWIWVGFALLFLPDGNPETFDRSNKLSYLTIIRLAQAMFLLTYSMSGLWKVFYGTVDALSGRAGNFSPPALTWTLADRILQTGSDPLLADVLIRNTWLAWPAFVMVIYIQVVSVIVAFRPSLHVSWGYLLIGFHFGTWVLMQIMFSEQVLLLLILFVLSPLRTSPGVTWRALAQLPVVGRLFGLIGDTVDGRRSPLT